MGIPDSIRVLYKYFLHNRILGFLEVYEHSVHIVPLEVTQSNHARFGDCIVIFHLLQFFMLNYC